MLKHAAPQQGAPSPGPRRMASLLAGLGDWMKRHDRLIRRVQWFIIAVYAVLIIVPVILPLPDDAAHLWSNLTLAAQFVFWGIWWPFVLLSMVLMGRIWCGVLCPEGSLSELASKFGRGRAIPHWMRWRGWPFAAFALTTIYGQLVSVYQYPKAVMLVLGGSTVAAIVVGLIYGREKRVWCKYLCPVNGVFSLLARISPLHYRVNEAAWRNSYTHGEHGHRVIPVNCAPLVPLRNMEGGADCHMCGRCSGHREAVQLAPRSPSDEIVRLGQAHANPWDSALVLFGLCGIAIGAFHWSASPWFVTLKQFCAGWLIDHDMLWPLDTNAPWFVLTHYAAQNDVFSWLDGALILAYICTTGLVYGGVLSLLLAGATRSLGGGWRSTRFHHLVQAFIPVAGCGVFLGLSATTLSLLRAEHVWLGWAPYVRGLLLLGANLWTAWLAWGVSGRHSSAGLRRVGALAWVVAALLVVDSAWWLMFIVW